MENTIKILQKSSLFYGIEDNDIKSMLKCLSSRQEEYERDEYILTAGNPSGEVGIVLKGSVNIINEDYWGNRTIIDKIEESGMFSESFSCSGIPQIPVSVVAVENTRLMFIDCKRIITTCPSACSFHTHLIENMVKILSEKNIMLTQKMLNIACRTTREKLLSYLSAKAKATDKNLFKIPFNRQELADYLCVDRSAMSKELCKLRDEGLLEFHKNTFKLL